MDQNKRLTHIGYELVQNKLTTLYESIDGISNIKNLEDKYCFTIDEQRGSIKHLKENLDYQR